MLYVCVRGVMDVVFSVCIVTRGAGGARVFAILLLNVMDLLSVIGGALLDRPSKECVCCACDSSECLDVPSICFLCLFVGSYRLI